MNDDIELSPEEFTVHASEKISTGDYENGTYSLSISGSVEGVGDLTKQEHEALFAHLLSVQRDLQHQVEQVAENRVKLRDSEDWGVGRE